MSGSPQSKPRVAVQGDLKDFFLIFNVDESFMHT